jgi:sulfur carrier protein
VAELGLAERRIAVELNRAVVSRTEYSRRALRSGDEVEIVHFIGGG